MPGIIKKYSALILALGIGLVLATVGMVALNKSFISPDTASAAEDTATVEVTATVQPYLQFSVSPTSVTLSPDLVDTAGNTHIGSSTNISLILGTSASGGWSITIKGANGGLATSTYDLIETVSGSSTLSAGTDGYGANATGSIAGVTIGDEYKYWGTVDVGEIPSSTSNTLASKSTSNASTTVALMKIYAACDAGQEVGTYADTVTLTATTSP